ncbi:MAG: ferrochelatase [Rhodospirillaceae bacterium]
MAEKLAVVLFNLGGPDSPEAVKPFLFNLFNDPAIISVPTPLRWMIAKLISSRRAPIAREIYGHIGGKSPLLEQTHDQAAAIAAGLTEKGFEALVVPAMRYWHPFATEAAQAVAAFQPDKIVALPLYPQFSTTTSGSSLKQWREVLAKTSITAPSLEVGCWPVLDGWCEAVAGLIRQSLPEAEEDDPQPRLLFSAHGLPKKVIDAGDPYQHQVERSVAKVLEILGPIPVEPVVCYQSKVGPLEWIGPATEDEIKRAGADGRPVIVVPIAFVSEHSETLVELDIEYRELAEEAKVPWYRRVPTAQTHPRFISALVEVIGTRLERSGECITVGADRVCQSSHTKCPCR